MNSSITAVILLTGMAIVFVSICGGLAAVILRMWNIE